MIKAITNAPKSIELHSAQCDNIRTLTGQKLHWEIPEKSDKHNRSK